MRARTVPLSAVGPADSERWRRLAELAVEPNPYFQVDFLRAAHRWLAPDVDPSVVLVEDGADLVGVLPYVERTVRGGVLVRTTEPPLGSTVLDLHTPLLGGPQPAAVASELVRELGRTPRAVPRPVLAVLAQHRLAGPTWDALVGAVGERHLQVQSRGERGAVLSGPQEGAGTPPGGRWPVGPEILGHLSAGRRKSLLRSLRALERDVGPVCWVDRTADTGAVDDFVELESAGWKGDVDRGGEGIATRDGARQWFGEVLTLLRDEGRLYVGELRAGDRRAFMTVDLRQGALWFGMRDVYDEALSRYGVGNLGRLAEVADLRARARSFDSSANPQVYPQAAGAYPDRLPVGRVRFGANAGGRAVLRAAGALRRTPGGAGR